MEPSDLIAIWISLMARAIDFLIEHWIMPLIINFYKIDSASAAVAAAAAKEDDDEDDDDDDDSEEGKERDGENFTQCFNAQQEKYHKSHSK